jgi:UDP-2,4-diacetamido-2,4,6-trideoxy-beta-L-altropyranose hydrolase
VRKVYFRADIGANIGMGHFFRSLALAEYLEGTFYTVFLIPTSYIHLSPLVEKVVSEIIEFAKTENLKDEARLINQLCEKDAVVVLDGYNFDDLYQKIIKSCSRILVSIDDIYAYPFVSDYIINIQPDLDHSKYAKQDYTTIISGPDYALLRKAFVKKALSGARVIKNVDSLVISMGGADPHNYTLKVLKVAVLFSNLTEIHVVLGKLYRFRDLLEAFIREHPQVIIYQSLSSFEFAETMIKSEIAIMPASTVSYEACAVGIGMVSGYTAENQKGILNGLCNAKAILNIHSFNAISEKLLYENINTLIQSPALINEQIDFQKKFIDGKAASRYINLFKSFK